MEVNESRKVRRTALEAITCEEAQRFAKDNSIDMNIAKFLEKGWKSGSGNTYYHISEKTGVLKKNHIAKVTHSMRYQYNVEIEIYSQQFDQYGMAIAQRAEEERGAKVKVTKHYPSQNNNLNLEESLA